MYRSDARSWLRRARTDRGEALARPPRGRPRGVLCRVRRVYKSTVRIKIKIKRHSRPMRSRPYASGHAKPDRSCPRRRLRPSVSGRVAALVRYISFLIARIQRGCGRAALRCAFQHLRPLVTVRKTAEAHTCGMSIEGGHGPLGMRAGLCAILPLRTGCRAH